MMINANELRIGNWVRHTNTFCKEEMELDFDLMKNEISGNEYPQFNPIPLSPEILEKCGFGSTGNTAKKNCFKSGRIIVEFFKEGHIGVWLREPNEDILLCNIKYLHSLQNLYHALTGQELKINI